MKKSNLLFIVFAFGLTGLKAQTPAMLKDIQPGQLSSGPWDFIDVNGILYFKADNGTSGLELWKSDGTASGTSMVKDINPGANSSMTALLPSMINYNGDLIFTADNGSGLALWKSDGTAAGTIKLNNVFSPYNFTIMNGTLYFATLGALWKTDGTVAGTTLVKSEVDVENMIVIGSTLYFSGNTDMYAFPILGSELWKSDGTAGGTVQIKDIESGNASSNPIELTNVNGTLFFSADVIGSGTELWKSDGTSGGTVMVKDINPGSGDGLSGGLINLNGTIFFHGDNGVDGGELWKSNGNSGGTVMVKDIEPGTEGSFPSTYAAVVMNNELYFSAYTSSAGMELWKTNGTSSGTVLVKNINPGFYSSIPAYLCPFNNLIYFTASDGSSYTQLWKTDGTAAGTILISDMGNTPNSAVNELTVSNGNIFFLGNDGSGNAGNELWILNGLSGLGEQSKANLSIRMYPNPVQDIMTLEHASNEETKTEILNLEGQIVKQLSLEQDKTSIDLSDLNPGIYFLKLSNTESSEVIRFVKN